MRNHVRGQAINFSTEQICAASTNGMSAEETSALQVSYGGEHAEAHVTYLPYSTPSKIDLGLCLAMFAGSGGNYLFHRIG